MAVAVVGATTIVAAVTVVAAVTIPTPLLSPTLDLGSQTTATTIQTASLSRLPIAPTFQA